MSVTALLKRIFSQNNGGSSCGQGWLFPDQAKSLMSHEFVSVEMTTHYEYNEQLQKPWCKGHWARGIRVLFTFNRGDDAV
jgi:hypothetical protein